MEGTETIAGCRVVGSAVSTTGALLRRSKVHFDALGLTDSRLPPAVLECTS